MAEAGYTECAWSVAWISLSLMIWICQSNAFAEKYRVQVNMHKLGKIAVRFSYLVETKKGFFKRSPFCALGKLSSWLGVFLPYPIPLGLGQIKR